MSLGKALRMRRVLDPKTKSTVMFACSHGTSAPTILKGCEDVRIPVEASAKGGANIIFLSLGMALRCKDVLERYRDVGLALKVSATAGGAEKPFQEIPIASVETALKLGADAVVALIPFAPTNETEIINWTAQLGEDCQKMGMPFIAEAEFPNAYSMEQSDFTSELGINYLKRSARLCVELGADVVKSNWTGKKEEFAEIIDCISGTPIVVAGGSKVSDLDLLERLVEAKEVGAAGCSVGRNIFQHNDPEGMTRAICAVMRDGKSPQSALSLIKK